MYTPMGPTLPVKSVPFSEPVHPKEAAQQGQEILSDIISSKSSLLPSILDYRLHEWIQKLTNADGGVFPNGISPKQMEALAHAQWANAIRAGRNIRPAWRGSNHLSALLSNEVRAGRLIRLQKACYIGCDSRRLPPPQGTCEVVCALCRNPINTNQGILLKCKTCRVSVHAECAYDRRRMPLNLATPTKQWIDNWHCLNCKRCNICNGIDKKEGLLCRNCDSMEHVRCQQSFNLDLLSYRFWTCSFCSQAMPQITRTSSAGATNQPPVISIPTPDNSHGGSPNDEKQNLDNQQSRMTNFALNSSMDGFFPMRSPQGVPGFMESPESLGHFQCLGLPARPAEDFEKISPRQEFIPSGSSGQLSSTPAPEFFDISSVKQWSTDRVAWYFRELGYHESAVAFKREEIDGAALLLMERSDIFLRLGLKIGPALKTFKAIRRLQKVGTKNQKN